jgi:hypothetical protein
LPKTGSYWYTCSAASAHGLDPGHSAGPGLAGVAHELHTPAQPPGPFRGAGVEAGVGVGDEEQHVGEDEADGRGLPAGLRWPTRQPGWQPDQQALLDDASYLANVGLARWIGPSPLPQ